MVQWAPNLALHISVQHLHRPDFNMLKYYYHYSEFPTLSKKNIIVVELSQEGNFELPTGKAT